ncbi:DUF397 domain-containing protein [Streptomyces sp. NPDC020597]|uniref:DUF397 domain-containing protein n=1 Tax=unclassified Streptomyces TaxID=2593676 RepID=UPI0037ADBAB0
MTVSRSRSTEAGPASSGGDGIEGAARPARIHVRDSEAESGPGLAPSLAAWAVFVTHTAK